MNFDYTSNRLMAKIEAKDLRVGMILKSMTDKLHLILSIEPGDEDELLNVYTVFTQDQKLKTLFIGINSKVMIV